MLTGIARVLMDDLAPVEAVAEQIIQRPTVERMTARDVAIVPHAPLAGHAVGEEPAAQGPHRTKLAVPPEDRPHGLGFARVDDQPPGLDVVAQGRLAAHPQAFLLRRGDLVPDALARELALELGEGEQDMEGEPSHRGGGVERLGHRDERHIMPVEDLDEPGKIRQRPGQPVDLVDDDDVDPPGLDVGEQALQRRARQRRAGDAAIVVAGG